MHKFIRYRIHFNFTIKLTTNFSKFQSCRFPNRTIPIPIIKSLIKSNLFHNFKRHSSSIPNTMKMNRSSSTLINKLRLKIKFKIFRSSNITINNSTTRRIKYFIFTFSLEKFKISFLINWNNWKFRFKWTIITTIICITWKKCFKYWKFFYKNFLYLFLISSLSIYNYIIWKTIMFIMKESYCLW